MTTARVAAALALAVLLAACGCAPPRPVWPRAEAPAEFEPRLAEAEQAMDALQQALAQRLMEELAGTKEPRGDTPWRHPRRAFGPD